MKAAKGETRNYLFSKQDLRRLIVPLIIEQFLAIFVGLADSIMVASVGEAAVSAVSLIDTVMILLINIFAALGTGGAIITGQALGRKREEEGCEATEQIMVLSAAASIVIMALMYLGKSFILHTVFGKIDAEVMENCNTYLMIVTASIPFVAIYSSGAAIHRSMGDSKTPMILSLIMNGMNLAGNALLLYGLGFGIEGAAIPTMISRTFAGLVMLALIRNPKKILHVRSYRQIRPHWYTMKKILHLGLPFSVENSMFQMGKILVMSLVSGFGTASIAANAVANNVASFAIIIGMAIGYALSAVSAQCVGAGDYVQVRYYTRKLMKFSYGGLILMNVLVVLFLPLLIRSYNLSAEAGGLAEKLILFHAVSGIFFWPPSFTLPNVLRASNDVGYCMWISMASMWIFRIGFSFLLGSYFHMGVMGVWIAMVVDWLVRGFFFVIRYRGKRWQLRAS